eukprot:CAMPEP_0119009176 /NCGR_PEP_ID=MMETSP1176-20130426/4189_1 /TAXON_ID=265551 /ORGANISM="Synedropsis recta cf, Strain CCMP1620" /LENGTH=738 /DNA_ID=CAMNT_0006961637 /DNA_START=21 /DNA_END=2237 /DNA_ORIENTATION=+
MAKNGMHRAESITFGAQRELPRLPIPSLDETLIKFSNVLRALQTPKEQEETKLIAEEFRRTDGPILQQLLVQYDEQGRQSQTLGSYVESFWDESYLAPDQSVVMNLNPFFVLEEGPDPKTARDPTKRAAALCLASVKLASLLKQETLSPDVFKKQTLCMDQFKVLFGATRVANKDGKDTIEVYPDSTHIAVLCRNQMFYFQALWPEDGTVAVDETDIVDILHAIRKNAAETCLFKSSKNALGVLTSLPRREWAVARDEIASNSIENAAGLHTIDSALFVLVLDDFIPADATETAANMLHGTYKLTPDDQQTGSCCNRWYDKLQIIVCGDGTAGVNFEHSSIDGHTALRFVSDIFAETIVVFAQSITKLVHGIGHIPSVINAETKRAALTLDENGSPTLDIFPKKLVFDIPRNVIQKIFYAETALGDEIVASDTVVLEFKDFGKSLIVANSMSPDGFVQMSMMLAYYRLYGKIVCTYEPVLTKTFYHGRTEAQRSATPEAAQFCRVWCSQSTDAEKLEALRVATKEHSRLVKEAAKGKGVDRHLFALKCIAERNKMPLPKFFQSKPWSTLNHTILSTSNCGNPALRMFGFGPVVADGFGVGYIIKDDALSYSVSSKHRQTQRYVNMLRRTLLDFKEMLKPINRVEVGGNAILSAAGRHRSLKNVKPLAPQEVDTYDDFFGESCHGEGLAIPMPEPEKGEGKAATSYFSVVRRKPSIKGNLLSRIGLHVKLSSGNISSDE